MVKERNGKTVWITGASSGLGLAAARAFAEDGWLVAAGARSFGVETEDYEGISGARLLSLDVTSGQSCGEFARAALEMSPRVDVLCCAAGILCLGSCEETGADSYRSVMETNFIGMTRMVERALPVMRKQGGGKIILFSSLNGLMGIPFQSAYTASKHAVEGYAECLALEVKPFGVDVCLVEPGDHKGGSEKYRAETGGGDDSPYAAEFRGARATIRGDEESGLSPASLARRVVREADRRKTRFRLRAAKIDQNAAVWLHGFLPWGLLRAILRGYYVKKGSI